MAVREREWVSATNGETVEVAVMWDSVEIGVSAPDGWTFVTLAPTQAIQVAWHILEALVVKPNA